MRGAPFPYLRTVPDGICELCHGTAETLAAITLEPARPISFVVGDREKQGWRMARVVWACGRHAGGSGGPVATPNTTMLRGTTALRPQELRLFDQIPYRKAGEAERRWTS